MKRKQPSCKCLDKAQAAAKPKGFSFVTKPMFNFAEKTFSTGGPFLLVERTDEAKKSRKSLPTVVCAYCPFCGKRT